MCIIATVKMAEVSGVVELDDVQFIERNDTDLNIW
jgi:hypothetical protein